MYWLDIQSRRIGGAMVKMKTVQISGMETCVLYKYFRVAERPDWMQFIMHHYIKAVVRPARALIFYDK